MNTNYQFQNIKFQYKNLGSQFENIEMQINYMNNQKLSEKIFSLGINIINNGIQALFMGIQIPDMIRNNISILNQINDLIIQIQNISNKIENIYYQMPIMNIESFNNKINKTKINVSFINCDRGNIVIDFGTATSFDIVNSKNQFIGGIITAGMKIQAEALSAKTSKLPKLNIEAPKNAIGRNTIDAMLSGIVRGHAAMVAGLIFECEKELGEKSTIIATGGYSSVISEYLIRKFDYINPDLTLIGLNILYKLNK